MQIYVHKNNQQLGPFTEAEIKAQLAAGAISLQDHVWWQGQAGWVPLAQTPFATGSPVSPPAPVSGMPVDLQTASTGGETSKLAIWSLVCACLTLFCGLLSSIPAVILGHLALGDIKKSPGRTGRGMAIAGLIIGYLMTLLNIVALVCYIIFLPQIMKIVKQQQAQQAAAMFQMTNSPDQASATPAPAPADTSTNAPAMTPRALPLDSNNPPSTVEPMTNSPTATPVTPDQSTNSPDTNSAPATTNAPDTTTNSAP